MICKDIHKAKDYWYEIMGCIVKRCKIYTNVIPQYANFDRKYQMTIFKYLTKMKTQAEALIKMSKKLQVIEKPPGRSITSKEILELVSNEIEIDIAYTLQTKNLK